ncbi:hypothetical protein J3R73_000059 [Labrys monachus]|uniref:Secreted protein n=1 Tax=Labrys monachus TaxID=217067 RepID=A0ABU0F6M2_9HYPH|nr:hypothetical protein [Labrys monachus]
MRVVLLCSSSLFRSVTAIPARTAPLASPLGARRSALGGHSRKILRSNRAIRNDLYQWSVPGWRRTPAARWRTLPGGDRPVGRRGCNAWRGKVPIRPFAREPLASLAGDDGRCRAPPIRLVRLLSDLNSEPCNVLAKFETLTYGMRCVKRHGLFSQRSEKLTQSTKWTRWRHLRCPSSNQAVAAYILRPRLPNCGPAAPCAGAVAGHGVNECARLTRPGRTPR